AEQQSGPVAGVIVQLGGQTPLGLARALAAAGIPVVGTSPEAIHLAEDRGEFGRVLEEAGLLAPRFDDATLAAYVQRATEASPEHPVLIDRFLDDAVEIDVDALFDGTELYLGGVMEHIEEAGIHSGDSACALPPITLGSADLLKIRAATEQLAARIGVRGLMNVQYAIKDDILFVIEANPRASRTVPFVSKATAVQLAKAAARIAVGESIADLRAAGVLPPTGDGTDLPADAPIAVKEAVLPFHRFRTVEGHGVDTVLGPEMKSTGEVMGLDAEFGTAFAKSQAAAYGSLPTEGTVFVSLANRDKRNAVFPIKRLADL